MKKIVFTSISTLETRLTSYFGDNINEKFKFGSYTRGTILPRKVDDNSDVDYMVVFDNSENYKSQTFLNRLKKVAETKYSTSEIYQSSPTIVLELNNIKFELVLAYKSWSTYYIPDGKGGWMATYPNDFNDTLIEANNNNSYKIKPLVRLMKHWNVSVNHHGLASSEIEKIISENMKYAYFTCTSYTDYTKKSI